MLDTTIPAPSPNAVGPQGGNPSNPVLHPHWKNASLDDSISGLHKFDGRTESARHGLKNEQPWHLMAAYMVNAGRTNSEIALAAGVTPATVSIVRAQKWFQQRCAQIANDFGAEIMGAVKGYAMEAVESIAELMKSAESERVRLSASQILLEQSEGKPVQKVLQGKMKSNLDPADEVEQIQRELAAIRNT